MNLNPPEKLFDGLIAKPNRNKIFFAMHYPLPLDEGVIRGYP